MVIIQEEKWLGKVTKDFVIETLVVFADSTNLQDCIAEITITNPDGGHKLMAHEYDCVENLHSYYEVVHKTVGGATAYIKTRNQWMVQKTFPEKLTITVPATMLEQFITTVEVSAYMQQLGIMEKPMAINQ